MLTPDPATDPPGQERPTRLIDPIYTVTSSNHSGNQDHTMSFRANADGLLTIKNKATGEVLKNAKTWLSLRIGNLIIRQN